MCTPVVLAVMAALGAGAPSSPLPHQPAPAAAPSRMAGAGEAAGDKAAGSMAAAPTVCTIAPNTPAAE